MIFFKVIVISCKNLFVIFFFKACQDANLVLPWTLLAYFFYFVWEAHHVDSEGERCIFLLLWQILIELWINSIEVELRTRNRAKVEPHKLPIGSCFYLNVNSHIFFKNFTISRVFLRLCDVLKPLNFSFVLKFVIFLRPQITLDIAFLIQILHSFKSSWSHGIYFRDFRWSSNEPFGCKSSRREINNALVCNIGSLNKVKVWLVRMTKRWTVHFEDLKWIAIVDDSPSSFHNNLLIFFIRLEGYLRKFVLFCKFVYCQFFCGPDRIFEYLFLFAHPLITCFRCKNIILRVCFPRSPLDLDKGFETAGLIKRDNHVALGDIKTLFCYASGNENPILFFLKLIDFLDLIGIFFLHFEEKLPKLGILHSFHLIC